MSTFTSIPPPLPPKSPSIRTFRSTNTYSTYTDHHTSTSDHQTTPSRPAQFHRAQQGIRTTASSIHLSIDGLAAVEGPGTPGRSGSIDPFEMEKEHEQDDDYDLTSEPGIANLPWPPPRNPSPNPTPSLNRQPSFSFLTSDPAQATSTSQGCDAVSRRSSRSSIASRRSLAPPPAPILLSPIIPGDKPIYRLSSQTVHSFQSGMADTGQSVEALGSAEGAQPIEQLGPSPPRIRDDSPRSAMAARSGSSLSNRSDSVGSALRAKARSMKSLKSSKSTTSSRKRISNSTIHRRSFQKRYGKWEVEMSPLLEMEARKVEEQLELEALLGRATVLERMLKAGNRVSGSARIPSLKRFASKSTRSSAHPTPDTARTTRSPSMRSFRHPFSRRIRREDQFTEIDSQSNFSSTPADTVVHAEQADLEKEKHWVVLIPDKNAPAPTEEEVSPQPTCFSFPSCASEKSPPPIQEEDQDRSIFLQSPHLGHRSPDHHHRQSVLSYISVGRWSNSTRGGRRRRNLILGISIGCVVGVILLTGLLAGLLARRTG